MKKGLIIGAGWAGLTAAFKLSQQGHQITLIDAAPQAGGRARSICVRNEWVDNGQHLFIGGYQYILSVLEELGIKEHDVFQRKPFRLELHHTIHDTKILLKNNKLPAPFHFIWSLLFAKGISYLDKKNAILLCLYLKKQQFLILKDEPLLHFLKKHKQSKKMIDWFWRPLALAALTTSIENASTQIFLNVLKDTFSRQKQYSDFLFPTVCLSDVLPNPILAYLATKNATLCFSERIQTLNILPQAIQAINHKNQYIADYCVLATPVWQTKQLLHTIPEMQSLAQDLSAFKPQPITTAYFFLKEPVNYHYPMLGKLGAQGQWYFDRHTCQQKHLLSVVISCEANIINSQDLLHAIWQDIQKAHPYLSTPLHQKIITDKRAAFEASFHIETIRPGNTTPISNLYLAGEYTQTGYPSTMEGAVKSGYLCAEKILAKDKC